MNIPTIESRASNIPMTKGITYVVITVRPIKIFVEYVGANMSIQVPLLVIDREVSRLCLHSYQMFLGVPDEITDMTRSLKMVET